MADGDTTTTTTTNDTTTTATTATLPWHHGVDAEILGHWNNKGVKLDDPKFVAVEMSKQAREAEKYIGVPPAQLIKLPKDANDQAGWNTVYSRLGVPAEAKDYDFTGIKHADGKELPAALADALRPALLAARVPKDRGAEVAKAVVKHLDDINAASTAEATAKVDAEKAELAKSWGKNADFNRLTAMQGAKRLGVDPETVALLEKHVGYSKVMEMFRKIGAGTNEDTFHDGGGPGGTGTPTTVEGAKSRLAELQRDPAWAKRWADGDPVAKKEWQDLTVIIAGVAA